MESSKRPNHHDSFLPLLIKKYDDGLFTSQLISPHFSGSINVSCAKGAGLALQEKNPGKIILLAGGTGIYPFIDTIDVLYKKALEHPIKEMILEMNPAVTDPCLDSFNFVIYASFTSQSDLHPMTLYQLNDLSWMLPKTKFLCYVKIGETQKRREFSKTYPKVKLSQERFEEFLGKHVSVR